MKYYAVRVGRKPGLYSTWSSCEEQVKGFPGAEFKAFSNKQAALAFISDASQTSLSLTHEENDKRGSIQHGVDIWVDGACLQHNTTGMKFGWAFVIFDGDREVHRESGHDIPEEARQHRNVAGEIYAVLQAVRWCVAQGIDRARIHYDYQGLASWVKGTWKTNTKWTQAYAQAVRDAGLQLEWKKVKAHSGEPSNDLVDQLAREAAAKDGNEEKNTSKV